MNGGWKGLDGRQQERRDPEVDRLYADVFGAPDGLRVLAALRDLTIERGSGPDASDRALAWMEGQRQLVRVIEARTAAGLQIDAKELRRRMAQAE